MCAWSARSGSGAHASGVRTCLSIHADAAPNRAAIGNNRCTLSALAPHRIDALAGRPREHQRTGRRRAAEGAHYPTCCSTLAQSGHIEASQDAAFTCSTAAQLARQRTSRTSSTRTSKCCATRTCRRCWSRPGSNLRVIEEEKSPIDPGRCGLCDSMRMILFHKRLFCYVVIVDDS